MESSGPVLRVLGVCQDIPDRRARMGHANARLGPAGRRELVRLMIEVGMPERQAAACLCVSSCTAHRWKARWLEASDELRRSGARAFDRSSRPHCSPMRTPVEVEARVCAERERTGWGPRLIAGQVGLAHSTVHAILKRHGRSRAPRTPREAFRRYEWPCPGDLLHMDIKRYRRFRRPGHPFIKDERQTSQRSTPSWALTTATLSSTTTHGWPTPNFCPTPAHPRSPPSPNAPWPGSGATASALAG